MKKPVVLALLAIGALFAGAVALLDRLAEEPAAPAASRGPAPEPPPPSPEAAPPGPPPPSAALVAPRPGEAPAPSAPPASPAPGRAGVDLLTSLRAARAEVLDCAGVTLLEPDQGRRAAQAARRRAAARSRATLALDLEPGDGEMLVREARLVASEGPNEDLGRCAVELLSGRTFPASGARPGALVKMQFVVEEPGP